MTFADIYGDAIEARFNTGQTTQIKRWINFREAQIHAAAEWPWKIVGPTSLTVTSGDSTPTMPSNIERPMAVYNEFGDRLAYATQADFDGLFLPGVASSTSGRPTVFKWNNGVMTLGDIPNANYTFTMTYERKLSHYAVGGALTVGPMSATTDYPLFDAEWHQILVTGALATGLKIENDPTWEPLEQEFAHMLAQMVEHYLPAVSVAGNMQYGSDWF